MHYAVLVTTCSYGASLRDVSCSAQFIEFLNEQGKPHCFLPHEFEGSYCELNISFDPGFNQTLSRVHMHDIILLCWVGGAGLLAMLKLGLTLRYPTVTLS